MVVAGGDTDAGTMYAVSNWSEATGGHLSLDRRHHPGAAAFASILRAQPAKEPAIVQRGFLVEAAPRQYHHAFVQDWTHVRSDGQDEIQLPGILVVRYQPECSIPTKGEPKLIGDVSTKASGYINTMYEVRLAHHG